MTIELYPPQDEIRRLELAAARNDDGEPLHPGLLLDTHALRETRAWLRETERGRARFLMLLRHPSHKAGTGRGKTLAMAAAYQGLSAMALRDATRRACSKGEVLYLRARDLRRVEERRRPELLARCSAAFGLVLDEVGTEPGGPGFRGFVRDDLARDLADMLEARADRGRRTVFGGNTDAAETFDRYGQRLASRAAPHGRRSRWLIECEGEDLRVAGVPPLPEIEDEHREPWPDEIARMSEDARRRFVLPLADEKSTTLSHLDAQDRAALERSMTAARLFDLVQAKAMAGEGWAVQALELARRMKA